MHANSREYRNRESLDQLVEIVVGSAYEVANTLGAGFLEKVYERALSRELVLRGISADTQVSFGVRYKGQQIGSYVADLVVGDQLIVELKCVDKFGPEHMAQAINYLKASGLKIALLINFKKPRIQWKRVVHELEVWSEPQN